jgi:hypothetical protein
MLRVGGLFILLTGLAISSAATGSERDRRQLLEGVKEIAAPGIPGGVGVCGESAFVLVVGKTGRELLTPVVAAARMGRGRVVGFGHDGYFGREALETADTGRLMLNAVRWASSGKSAPRIGLVGLPQMQAFLQRAGLHATAASVDSDLSALDLLVMTHPDLTERQIMRLRAYVRGGGGLVAASTGWGWQMITGRAFVLHPLNQVTRESGLVWTGAMLDRTSARGFDASAAFTPLVHAGSAAKALTLHRQGARSLAPTESAQCLSSLLQAAVCLPDSDRLLMPKLRALRAGAGPAAVPTAQSPVTLKEPLRRLTAALDTMEAQRARPERVRPHPAAAVFPGAVPADAPRVTRRWMVDTRTPGWHSLGLYAAPGERITVEIPADSARSRLSVRIGAHTDTLWDHETWRRAPEISRSFALDSPKTQIASAFGGLIYLEVPEGAKPERVEAVISGAVEAPLFRLGQTTREEWRSRVRRLPGPWAELATDKIVLTVPSEAVRTLDDPESLMRFWDQVMDACADLAGWSRERVRPERIVADEQIAAGYMHSGYPIMTHQDVAGLVVDEAKLRREGSWGHFHELGHNHQSGDWTFEGTGEVTVNLFSMYIYHAVLGQPFDQGHPAIRDRAQREERVRQYRQNGASFEVWKSDPFLALTQYIQVIEAFGWEPIKRTIAEYRALPAGQRPRTDDEKRDQWMVRLSRAVGRNLGPFFQSWGVPTSEPARASLADLPTWMPSEGSAQER